MADSNIRVKKNPKEVNKFLKQFGRIPMPDCYVCSKAANVFKIDRSENKTIQVTSMGIDWDQARHSIKFYVECHGDRQEVFFPYPDVLKHNLIRVKVAFAPGQSSRINGVLVQEVKM